jgi:uncharacterized protein YndB with AHSA1/START domain
MTHPLEIELHTELPATPEQVWEAIATGPGIDSWFTGRNEVEPLEGGRVTMETGDHREQAEVTAYDASTRFATRTAPAADGRFVAFDYLVDGRDGGSTLLHVMHSGMLGDDWHDEYDALRRGWPFHLNTLREYLAHFPGRTALPIFAAAPMGGRSAADVRALLAAAPSLQAPITTGAPARGGPGDLLPLDGEVFWADDERFAVHAADAIYTFHHGPERDAHVPPPVRPNQRPGRGRLAAVANQAPRLTQGNPHSGRRTPPCVP